MTSAWRLLPPHAYNRFYRRVCRYRTQTSILSTAAVRPQVICQQSSSSSLPVKYLSSSSSSTFVLSSRVSYSSTHSRLKQISGTDSRGTGATRTIRRSMGSWRLAVRDASVAAEIDCYSTCPYGQLASLPLCYSTNSGLMQLISCYQHVWNSGNTYAVIHSWFFVSLPPFRLLISYRLLACNLQRKLNRKLYRSACRRSETNSIMRCVLFNAAKQRFLLSNVTYSKRWFYLWNSWRWLPVYRMQSDILGDAVDYDEQLWYNAVWDWRLELTHPPYVQLSGRYV